MELFQELLLTLLVAVLSSFLIAKVVSRATGGASGSVDGSSDVASPERNRDQDDVGDVSEQLIMEELNCAGRLEARGLGSEGRAEFVAESVDRVEEFIGQPAPVDEGASGNECREVTEKHTGEATEVNEGVAIVGGDPRDLVVQSTKKRGETEIVAEEGEAVEIRLAQPPEEIGTAAAAREPIDEGKNMEIGIDDDWEGIERSDLEKVFASASKFVESGYGEEKLARIGSDVQMELYGLHKLVTEGPCHEQPPMALKLSARAKWNAWQKLGNMDPEVAMEQYVTLLSDNVPRWSEGESSTSGDDDTAEAVDSGVDISSPASHHHPNFPYER